ncbi:MAG: tetratricopeptide repeat protein [Bacteroidetes bacterium]|nr:tetratricopeptide repeat protein [Bacteroidota bacterium]
MFHSVFLSCFLVLAFQLSLTAFSASREADSLELLLQHTTDPKEKIRILNNLFLEYEFADQQLATRYLNEAFELAVNSPHQKELATVYTHQGYFAEDTGNYKAAEENYLHALEISTDLNDIAGIFAGYNHMGVTYKYQGDFPRSLSYYLKALKLLEKWEKYVYRSGTEKEIRQLKKGFSTIYNNIGNLHYNQADYRESEPYFLKAVLLDKALENESGLAIDYNNLALLYWRLDDFPKSLAYSDSCIQINLKNEFIPGVADGLMNKGITLKYMAALARDKGDLKLADSLINCVISDNFRVIEMKAQSGDKLGIANTYHNLGIIYYDAGDYRQARTFFNTARTMLEEINNKATLVNTYKTLYRLDSAEHQWQSAFDNYGRYVRLKDLLINEENTKKIVEMEMNHLFDQERAQDSLMHVESDKIKDAQIAAQEATILQEKTFKIALFGGLAMLALFAFFIFNRLRVTRRQKNIIEFQKQEVEIQKEALEEKNKEILDSINYAKRIQDAILPPLSQLSDFIPDSFILYLPKDIVAGDFYWMEKRESRFCFAVADCTGHGVPGAMVSVLCSNALTKCIRELNISEPAGILDKTTEILQHSFEKSTNAMNDGMDIALTVIDLDQKTLAFAGANNSLYLVRSGELIEIKADKQPVGKFDNRKPFSEKRIELLKGDCFFLFTDGYADQFGGKDGKKFKDKNLKKLLVENAHLEMKQLRVVLESNFKAWRGSLEQIDDICIAGIRIQ